MRARGFHLAVLAIVLLYAAPISGHAAVVNGGFDTGTFAGWDVIGDTSVQTASVGISPTHGCCMALLTTINTDFGGVPFSLHFAANSVIGSFLEYSFSELQNIPVAYPGHNEPYSIGQSAIKQTVQGHAGELLSFDAYWVTTDGIGTDGGVLSIVPSPSGPKVLVFLSPPLFSGLGTVSPVPLCQHAPAWKPAETILLVDDDSEVLALAADILRGAGYLVLSTGDPREALRIARTRAEPLHLLLTDVVMPRMSGRQLAEELRAIRSEVKVLFMSAYSIETVEDYLILLAPGEPFVVKPFTMAELKSKVRATLEYRSPFSRPRVSRDGHDHD